MRTLQDYIDEQSAASPTFAEALRDATAELDLAVQLTRLREARGLTQKQLAERLGIAQAAVARYERGGRTPTLVTALRFAAALNAAIVLGSDFRVTVVDRSHDADHIAAAASTKSATSGKRLGMPAAHHLP
jgi:transcriptional regulator with XRE-family HTH domain